MSEYQTREVCLMDLGDVVEAELDDGQVVTGTVILFEIDYDNVWVGLDVNGSYVPSAEVARWRLT